MPWDVSLVVTLAGRKWTTSCLRQRYRQVRWGFATIVSICGVRSPGNDLQDGDEQFQGTALRSRPRADETPAIFWLDLLSRRPSHRSPSPRAD